MPIISFNISNHLKKFLRQMVGTNEYKNNSNVMRAALVRLMQEKEDVISSEVESANVLETMLPQITSSVLITIEKFNSKLERKINRIESNYHKNIKHKSTYSHEDKKTCMYVFEGTMHKIQTLITELNALEEIQAFRYIINEPAE